MVSPRSGSPAIVSVMNAEDLAELGEVDRADVGAVRVAEVHEREATIGLGPQVVGLTLGVREHDRRLLEGDRQLDAGVRTLEAIARCGSFASAGRELRRATSAVSSSK